MSDYKCKICGGTLNVTEGSTTAVCEYCGNTQTVSKSRDEVIQNLLNRANHLRSICEFDKAQRTYEKVLEYDENDAEAHFGLLLSKYGIEYVKDPATGKYIPTCHRVQYESILTDGDYIAAIENADLSQQPVYTAQVVEISRIQKDILGVVKNEKPFDVFICYKETDANGKRTIDSVIANDIYYELTEAGFKVFFAAITLENKLGQEYEPYIFAALHSAKVMLVVGTKPEYFNAVWVKNEWSRYLKLMKTDRSRTLIPCYRDMDAYDLPDEFSHLQAQDMSKIGFINDVVRGIRKLFTNENDSEVISAAAAPVAPPAGVYSNTVPLLERAFMFLEDGKWDDANEYCEKVLDADPKNARAYLGKLMAELRTRTENNLKNLGEPFDNNSNYSKAIRFGDEKLVAKLKDDNDFIRERNKNLRLSGIYSDAQSIMNGAKTEREYLNAAKKFESIPEFKDSKELAKECKEKAEICRKDSLYASAKAKMNGESIDGYESAIKTFDSIRGWKDADEQIEICKQKIEEIKEEAKRKAEAERIAMKKSAERSKKALAVITIAVCVCVAMAILWTNVLQPMVKYNSAVSLMDNGKYEDAVEAFEALNGYKDSEEQIVTCKECAYTDAVALMDDEKYDEAIVAFESMNGYKDSEEQISACKTAIKECAYADAVALMGAENVVEAYEALMALDGYKDSLKKAASLYDQCEADKINLATTGGFVFLGAYEQDNNTSNGKEDIEWLVLEVKDGKALVISKYALDCKQYNTSYTDVTWETCTLRKWLNNDFINAAFSADEKAMIPTVTVSADKNPDYNTNPGNATQDQVFLLSITEANKYFSSDSARECKPTDYAVASGANSFSGNCLWWLRSPGYDRIDAAYVLNDGTIPKYGGIVDADSAAVRPALWIDLSN